MIYWLILKLIVNTTQYQHLIHTWGNEIKGSFIVSIHLRFRVIVTDKYSTTFMTVIAIHRK